MGQDYSIQNFFTENVGQKPRVTSQPVDKIIMFNLSKDGTTKQSSVLLEDDTSLHESQQLRVSTVIEMPSAAFIVEQYPKYPLKLSITAVLAPLAVFDVRDTPVTTKYVQSLIHEYLQEDDVLCSDFLSTIIFVTDQDTVADDVDSCLASFGCKTLYLVPTAYSITKGPYFFSCRGLFQTSRLYPDTQEAFVLSTVPSQHDKNLYMSLNASAYGATTLCVAVPSRHYFTPSAELPLEGLRVAIKEEGLRVAIKDMFHLKGVRTTCGNRAYANLYGTQDVTSATVQRLIDQGAIIVGKTKTAEFAGSQEVIGDWADYSYAFNARADGHLRSTGSSTGSAAGIASYPWLDVGLGSDAGGSVRDPAIHHGIFGFRPTHHGATERDTPLPCPKFHRSGHLARDMESMINVARHGLNLRLFGGNDEAYRPKRVVYLEEYASDRSDVQQIFEHVISQLSQWLGTETVRVSLESLWEKTNFEGTSESFADYFKTTFMEVLASDYWSHGSQFQQDYQQKFQSAPYICKITRWNFGASITSSQIRAALDKIVLHNSWFFQHVLWNLDTIIVLPQYNMQYRDDYLGPPEDRVFFDFDSNLHATFAGLPELVVPIGQFPFHSQISTCVEFIPVSLSIIAHRGMDMQLLGLVNDFLKENGLSNSVLPGKTAFPTETRSTAYNDF